MKFPKTPRDIGKFIDFLRVLCASINGKPEGFIGTAKGVESAHCHTRVAKFLQTHTQENPKAMVVILGTPGSYYAIAHSLVVSHDESAILVDAYTGHFLEGQYIADLQGHKKHYLIYAAYYAADLVELAKAPDFDVALEHLRVAPFEGDDIPSIGHAKVQIRK